MLIYLHVGSPGADGIHQVAAGGGPGVTQRHVVHAPVAPPSRPGLPSGQVHGRRAGRLQRDRLPGAGTVHAAGAQARER